MMRLQQRHLKHLHQVGVSEEVEVEEVEEEVERGSTTMEDVAATCEYYDCYDENYYDDVDVDVDDDDDDDD